MTPELSFDEIINILKQNNFCFDKKNNNKNELNLNLKQIHDKKENLSHIKNGGNINNLFNEEYANLFNRDSNNNDINFEPLKNNNFYLNLRKDSLFSDISSFRDIGDFNNDKEKLFE